MSVPALRDAAAILVFALTYLTMAIGRLPGFRLDRTGAALLGAALMVALGVLPLDAAYRAIDGDTIVLLLGVMIVVAHLKLSGLFAALADGIAARVRWPLPLLLLVLGASAILSAFLVNDTICLVLTPLVLDLTLRLKRDPVPYLLGLAMASNIGSVATVTGNPQNIMIGSFSGIAYSRFAASLTPVALGGLAIAAVAIVAAYRREFFGNPIETPPPRGARLHRPLAFRTLAITACMVAGFFLVEPAAKPAIIAGSALLLTRSVKPRRIYREIDWGLLVMFSGLFIVVAGGARVLLTPAVLQTVGGWQLGEVSVLTAVAAILSNLVSNVPAVLLLRPFVAALPDPGTGWLTLAMASTLAGNLTILGSVANLIVVERARERGVVISFWTYFRLGVPVTLATLVLGAAILALK